MDGHDHALMWSPPSPQCGPRGDGTLGVDDAVVNSGEAAAQGLAQEDLVPVAIPPDVCRPAAALQKVADAEDGSDERATPGEGGDQGGGPALTFEVLTQLPEVRVDAGDALLSQDSRDDQRG